MTIETIIHCDALSCCNEREIEMDSDPAILSAGWHTDPNDEFTHYCPTCWPEVKKELEEDA